MDRPARCPVCGAEVDSCGCTNTDCGYARSVALSMCPDCGWDEKIFRHTREQCQSRQIHQWAMVRDAENDAKSEALRAMQAEGQKLADILKEYQAGFRPGFTRRVDAALAAWGMVAMGFERHEPPNVHKRRGRNTAKIAGCAMVRALDLAMKAGREAQRAHEAVLRLNRERARQVQDA